MHSALKLAALALAAGVSACSNLTPVSSSSSGAAGIASTPAVVEAPDWRVADIRVTVPETLFISELNAYYPIADIVWRGDPPGDRRAQIADLLGGALAEGTRQLQGSRPVALDVTVTRFHSVTERTRYTFGGVHSIHYTLRVADARTGEVLYGPQRVDASLNALGGQRAIEADARGETQKVRITRHVAALTQAAFVAPAPARLAAAD